MRDVYENLVGGSWRGGSTVSENRSPANPSDLIGHYAQANLADVEAAVAAARDAQPRWARTSLQQRADVLSRVGATLLGRADAIGRLLSREEGKTFAEARAEVLRAGQIFQFYSGEALRNSGEKLTSIRDEVEVDVTREPVGVVALITPWNFPIAIPAWKMAPALAAGNAVILKPAELTPGCAHALVEIVREAGCPDGVVNLLMGHGAQIGAALAEHPDIDAVSFTGSERTGARIALACARTMKKAQLEMGGKNPMVVLADADLDLAVSVCVNGAFYSTGQRCTASSRIIVEEGVREEFIGKLCASVQSLRIGDPLDETTQVGPVVSEAQLGSNLAFVEIAKEEGCEVVGGNRLDREGFFQRPALFLGASNVMRVSREEIFGPCASVIAVSDFDEALAVANDTPYGLSAGICTRSLKHASAFRRRSTAGMVMVNLPTAGVDYHVPFGGRGSSSLGGREQGRIAMDFFTTVKTSYTFAA